MVFALLRILRVGEQTPLPFVPPIYMTLRPLLALTILFPSVLHSQPFLRAIDMEPLEGTWAGELTYVDYSTGKDIAIPATLKITYVGSAGWAFVYSYPDEPGSIDRDTLILAPDGTELGHMSVVADEHASSDTTRIVLEEEGRDDDLPARIRRTWIVTPHSLLLLKEVCSRGERAFRKRHAYRFSR